MRIRVALSILCLTCRAGGRAGARAVRRAQAASNLATGENYHVEIGGYFWNPDARHLDRAANALPRHHRRHDRLRRRTSASRRHVRADQGRAAPGEEAQVALRVHPDQLRAAEGRRSGATSSSTASALHCSRCRCRPSSTGTRTGSPTSTTSSTGTAASSASCSKPSTPTSSRRCTNVLDRVRPRPRPDPGDRRHRPRLRRAEHLDHRRVQRFQAAREHRRRLPGQVLRLRSLRHRELQRPRRRPGRLPLLRRVLPIDDEDEGELKLKGLYLGGVVRF